MNAPLPTAPTRGPVFIVIAALAGLIGVSGLFAGVSNAFVTKPAPVAALPTARPPTSPAPAASASAPDDSAVPSQTFEQVPAEDARAINAKIPISALPNPAARPFLLKTLDADDQTRAQTCLTLALYYEAGSQGRDGEAAVAQVILNRLRHPLFPKSVCGVVFQGASRTTGCQFTFACDGSLNRPPTADGWKQAYEVAKRALAGHVEKAVGDATHYHADYVVPYWQPTLVKVAQIGAHIFYRWPGGMGMPGAFKGQYAGTEPPPPQLRGLDPIFAQNAILTSDDAALTPKQRVANLEAAVEAARTQSAAPTTAIAWPPAIRWQNPPQAAAAPVDTPASATPAALGGASSFIGRASIDSAHAGGAPT